jgi:restriction system protein
LQAKGWAACAVGLGMLVVMPLLAGPTPVGQAVVQGLRPVGWLALAVGVLLLALHYMLRGKAPRLQVQTSQRMPQPYAGKGTGAGGAPTAPILQPEPNTPPTPEGAVPHASRRAANEPAQAWGPAVFEAIEWRRFEAVCETLFAQAGFETRSQSHGADGGVDIWLHSINSPGPAAVVQCKHWRSKPVGVRELREFLGVMTSHQLKRGTYATTSTYTPDALAFAKANSIHTLDGAGLLQLIARRTPEQQQALLQVAYEGEYWRPTCASCGNKMVERTRRADGRKFWACAQGRRCQHTMGMAGG